MKQIKTLSFALLVLFVMAGIAWSAPRLTIDEPQFDFGFIPQHAKVSHVFWLRSTGDDELKILKVVPG